MKKAILIIVTTVMAFVGYAQEWEYSIVYGLEDSLTLIDAKPLSNGDIAISSIWSRQPALLVLSPEGEVMARDSFPQPAFWGRCPYVLSDEEGTTYILTAYNPDHDSTNANYYQSFDNPPDYSILALYKLDEQLSVVESHEHQIPVDTTDAQGDLFFGGLNDFCGNIYVFSAFVDEGTIVGGYTKQVSMDFHNPHGNDSIFFFRMSFDGTLISRVGYEINPGSEPGGGLLNWSAILSGYNMFKVGSSYYFFLNRFFITGYGRQFEAEKNGTPGHSYRLDSAFNILDMKRYHQRNGLGENYFGDPSYIASRHNTAYLSCEYIPPGSSGCTGCALYEYALDNAKAGNLSIVRYIERKKGPRTWDDAALRKGVALASDNSLYYAYTLEDGRDGITIEHLTADFDTLSTFYYVLKPMAQQYSDTRVRTIAVTETDDVLMTYYLWTHFDGYSQTTTAVVKFPAEAFVGGEEAHANGLKVAMAYPNPGGNTLNIRMGLPNARLEVYDASGRMVHGQQITEGETPVNAETWSPGVYLWKVYSNNKEVETGKWIKE